MSKINSYLLKTSSRYEQNLIEAKHIERKKAKEASNKIKTSNQNIAATHQRESWINLASGVLQIISGSIGIFGNNSNDAKLYQKICDKIGSAHGAIGAFSQFGSKIVESNRTKSHGNNRLSEMNWQKINTNKQTISDELRRIEDAITRALQSR